MPLPGASDISPVTQQLVDEEVRHLIENAHEQVTQLMSANRDKLDALAQALLEHETLEQEEAYAAAGIKAPGEPVALDTRPSPTGTSGRDVNDQGNQRRA
jgi:cell division protease FtsH